MLLDAKSSGDFLEQVSKNPINAALIERLPSLGLPGCWLVAGCLFQTIWNVQTRRPPAEHIRDYDVFYYDASDLSYEAEDFHIKRLSQAFAELGAAIELRNQARVHLWYKAKFGQPYEPLASSTDGIDRFLISCTCIGVRCVPGAPPAVYARYGLDDLYEGILRPNPLNFHAGLFAGKAQSYLERWPWLRVDPGN
jgi:hypothetical protein